MKISTLIAAATLGFATTTAFAGSVPGSGSEVVAPRLASVHERSTSPAIFDARLQRGREINAWGHIFYVD